MASDKRENNLLYLADHHRFRWVTPVFSEAIHEPLPVRNSISHFNSSPCRAV